jgi:hypothetical protein
MTCTAGYARRLRHLVGTVILTVAQQAVAQTLA